MIINITIDQINTTTDLSGWNKSSRNTSVKRKYKKIQRRVDCNEILITCREIKRHSPNNFSRTKELRMRLNRATARIKRNGKGQNDAMLARTYTHAGLESRAQCCVLTNKEWHVAPAASDGTGCTVKRYATNNVSTGTKKRSLGKGQKRATNSGAMSYSWTI